MIVKNEEKMLSGCLESVHNIADEIIIVDTGSDDKTIQIAERFNAKIHHFP
jgi:glycosyltransferase involved in cell wall biosynthesis